MKNLFLYVFLLISATVTAQTVGTGGTRPDNPGIIEKGRVSVSTSTGKSLWTRLKRTNNLGYVNGVFTWIETDGIDSLSKSANLDTRYLQTSSASTTYVPFTGGTLLGPLTLANSVRVGGTGSIDNNTYLGKNTLISRTSGTNNTAIGQAVLSSVTSGSNNTVVGNNSGASISTGQYNTIIGAGLTSGLTVGSYNTIIGAGALPGITSGMSNTLILADGQGNRRLNIFSDGNAMIGTNSYYGETRLGVFGGVNGANVDIRGNSGAFVDQSTLEVEGNDYDTNTRSAFLQYRGSTYTGTSNGFPNNNLARLVMNGDNNLIMTGLAKPLVLGTNFTSRMVIDTVGNVGIGTALPTQRLTVLQSTGSSVPSIGSAGGHLLLTNGSYGLMQGVNTAGNSWLQAARTDGIATNYNILLNPNGGNVGIGTAAPLTRLDITNGSGQYDTNLTLRNSTHATSRRAGILLGNTGASFQLGSDLSGNGTNDFFIFDNINFLTRFIINNAGNAGIGTAAPTAKLTIANVPASTNSLDIVANATTSQSYGARIYAGTNSSDYALRLINSTGSKELFYVRGDGNVGVGTNAPLSTLHAVSQATAPKEVATFETVGAAGKPYVNFRAESANMGYLGWGAANNKMFLMNYNNESIEIGTNSVSRVAVTGTGAVGVGTTNPLSNLHLNSTTADVYSRFTGSSSTNGGLMIGVGTVNQSVFLNRENTDMEFYTNNTLKAIVKAGGNFGVGTLTPNKKAELANAGEVSLRLNNTGANTWDLTNEATQGAFQLIRGGSNVYFHIGNTGNVGVGTTSPLYRLQVNDVTGGNVGVNSNGSLHINYQAEAVPRITIDRDAVGGGNAGIIFKTGGTGTNAGNGSGIGSPASQKLALYTSNGTNLTERMLIDGNGNVGVGTAAPTSLFHTATQLQQNTLTVESNNANPALAGLMKISQNNRTGLNYRGELQLSLLSHNGTTYYDNEVMTAKHDGKIGFGTTTPLYNLHVNSKNGSNSEIRLTSETPGSANVMFWNAQTESYIGNFSNHDFYIRTNNINRAVFTANGNFGIGTNTPNAQLQLTNTTVNRKIVLYEGTNNDHQFYGFGVNAGVLRYQVNGTQDAHVFYAGTGSTTSQEAFRITGDQTVTYVPLTTTQINALVKAKGKVAYNSDTDKMVYCTGTSGVWKYFDGSNM